MEKKKLYCYIDESGQDTLGKLFVVSIVISRNKEGLEKQLIKIEDKQNSHLKWRKTKHSFRINYIEEIISLSLVKKSIYIAQYPESGKAYTDLTIYSTAKAIKNIRSLSSYQIRVVIDGLKKSEIHYYKSEIKKLNLYPYSVQGAREESSPILRLADMILGLYRDYFEGKRYAEKLVNKLEKNSIVKRV